MLARDAPITTSESRQGLSIELPFAPIFSPDLIGQMGAPGLCFRLSGGQLMYGKHQIIHAGDHQQIIAVIVVILGIVAFVYFGASRETLTSVGGPMPAASAVHLKSRTM